MFEILVCIHSTFVGCAEFRGVAELLSMHDVFNFKQGRTSKIYPRAASENSIVNLSDVCRCSLIRL